VKYITCVVIEHRTPLEFLTSEFPPPLARQESESTEQDRSPRQSSRALFRSMSSETVSDLTELLLVVQFRLQLQLPFANLSDIRHNLAV